MQRLEFTFNFPSWAAVTNITKERWWCCFGIYLLNGSHLGNRGQWAANTAHTHRKNQTTTSRRVKARLQDQEALASARSRSSFSASRVLLVAAPASSASSSTTHSSNKYKKNFLPIEIVMLLLGSTWLVNINKLFSSSSFFSFYTKIPCHCQLSV